MRKGQFTAKEWRERTKLAKVRRKKRHDLVKKQKGDQHARSAHFKHDRVGMATCGKKIRYESEGEAAIYMLIHSTPMTPLRSYQCPYCGGWHITHRPSDDHNDEEAPNT